MIVFLFTPAVIRICLRFKLLDLPSKRKIHTHPLPRLGGIVLIIAFIVVFLFNFTIDGGFRDIFSSKTTGLFAAILLISLLGLWDDIRSVTPAIKLFTQTVAALVIFYSGLRVEFFTNPLGGEIRLHFLISLFLTILWIIGMINTINLIDGLDGLASGIACIAGFFLLLAGIYTKNSESVILLSIVCGSALAFLYYNFPPAKIFLGDTGSMFLGFILAVTGLTGTQHKTVTTVALLIPVGALCIPILEICLTIWRRVVKKGSIFIADKKHLHHRFLEMGMTQKRVVIVFYIASVYFGIIAFLFVLIPNEYALLLLFLLAIGLLSVIKTIDFIERKIRKMNILK